MFVSEMVNCTLRNHIISLTVRWFGLWCLTPLSIMFRLYRGGQSYWWRKLEHPEKTTRPASTHRQTKSHNVVSSTTRLSGIQTHNVNGDRY